MDADMTAEIAALRSEIAQLRMEMLQAQSGDMAGGEGMDNGLPLVPIGGDVQGAFAVVDGKITNRHYMVARTVYNVSGNDPDATNGTWYLVVPHVAPSSATLTTSPSGITNDTQTVIPLFTISNGEISDDYRGMPIVMIRE